MRAPCFNIIALRYFSIHDVTYAAAARWRKSFLATINTSGWSGATGAATLFGTALSPSPTLTPAAGRAAVRRVGDMIADYRADAARDGGHFCAIGADFAARSNLRRRARPPTISLSTAARAGDAARHIASA